MDAGGYYGRNIPIHTYIADLTGYKFATTTPTSVTMGSSQPVQITFEDGSGGVAGSGGTLQTMYITFPTINVPAAPTVATVMNNGFATGGSASGNWA